MRFRPTAGRVASFLSFAYLFFRQEAGTGTAS